MMPLRYTYKGSPPRRYQQQALMKIYQLGGRAGLFLPMRTGKSRIAIDWAGISHVNFGLYRVVIVCPKTTMDVWLEQIERYCPAQSYITILDETTKANAATAEAIIANTPPEGVHWVIVNYEMVWRVLKKGTRPGLDWTLDRLLARWQPDLIIADEAHRLKWPNTRTSEAMARLGQAAPMKLALTGTPITKWPFDAFGIFRFVNSDIFGIGRSAWKNMRARYGVWSHATYAEHAEVLVRLQNEQELVSKIHANSFRIRLEDAIPELPERITQNVRVRMSAEAQRMYREMAADMITEVNDKTATADIILVKTLRLSTLTSGWIKDTEGVIHDIDDAKLRACMDLVEDMLDQDEKVIVFCHYVHDYERVFEALQKRKIKAVLHAGTGKQKTAAKTAFQTDPSVKVFVSQTATGSLGLDLSAARMIIMYSWDHRWDTYTQAVERTFMPGKTAALGLYHLVVPSTIDSLKLRVIKKKGDLAEAILFDPQQLFESFDDAE